MEIGKKRFCPRVFFRCRTKLAKLGDLSTDAVFGSYRGQFPDKNEAENPIFVRALDKNVFVPILSCFGPPNYPLSHGTISFSAKVSPLTISSPYFFQSALRISSTPLLIFFPNNLLEIVLTSVMVGGAFEGFDFAGEAEDVVVGRFSPLPSLEQMLSRIHRNNGSRH